MPAGLSSIIPNIQRKKQPRFSVHVQFSPLLATELCFLLFCIEEWLAHRDFSEVFVLFYLCWNGARDGVKGKLGQEVQGRKVCKYFFFHYWTGE